jgi:hypothetical protein
MESKIESLIETNAAPEHTQDDIAQVLNNCIDEEKVDNPQIDSTPEINSASDSVLDSMLLDILGDDPTATAEYGKDINDQLASRLDYFASNGLTKEARKELSEKYLVPSNCVRIGAPTLNAEIKAALPENLVKRDKAIETRQNLLAKAISSLGSAISDELSTTNKNQDLLKKLMDTGRLLCDIQHAESVTRRNFALYALKKDLKEHLFNTKIDKYLFGENLSETLKTAKAVSKSGTDLKVSTASTSKKFTPTPKNQNKNLNWKTPAPPRRQQGPQRSREPATRRQPPSSSKQSPRRFGTTRRR